MYLLIFSTDQKIKKKKICKLLYFIGCNPNEIVKNTNRHNLVTVFFVTPILCLHCKDYIWGRGRQGVSCKGM